MEGLDGLGERTNLDIRYTAISETVRVVNRAWRDWWRS
jgi:hypothetical protein